MNYADSEWEESYFPLYASSGVVSLYGTSNLPMHTINEPLTVVIAMASGKGSLQADNRTYELEEGSVVLLPAHCQASLIMDRQESLHAYMLKISTQEKLLPHRSEAVMQRSEMTSRRHVRCHLYEPTIVAKVEELYVHRSPADEVRHVRNQLLLHEIILSLLERDEAKYRANEQPSMERSIAYMENNFSNKISREQLAAYAGISRSHYSILFRQHTGFSPSDYLTRLRVHRAIELLMTSSGTLREIALKVGYRDEFYLSRRFKQLTGAAPSGYNPGSIPRVAVVLIPYASHLLLLGLEPAVTISDQSTYVHTAGLKKPESMIFIDAESTVDQMKSVLLANKIELIIAARQHLQGMGLTPEQLRAVAPVIEIPWMEIGWKEQLRLIAKAVRRSEQAERWLAAFEQEERAARLAVQHSAVAEECVTIFVLRPEKLLVYGGRNIGYVIYQSLGLKPPALIQQQMEKQRDQFHSVPIALSQLADYAGDRLLVVMYPDERGSTAHAEKIFQSAEWNALPAVRRKCVHMLDIDEWVPYNPVSIRLQLHRAEALFNHPV
ncbi:helix-turn-helix domain-containing protein [Paenibacillus sp. GCM10027626]|uniref:helix-turn-helix domain-containing protein n=1 Tax=Paenibacillus sp. GCM10027626 TaxID=3273411 RepID=UPI003640DDD0